MPKMSAAELKSLLANEKASALSGMASSKLSEDRSKATDYFMGDMSRDLPAQDGRSSAVSTDVSDTIEGLMPTLMDIFTSGGEVVKFYPVGPEDIEAAAQETDYINHVFNEKNPGFMVLYSFIKDALLHKNGVVKVWWEEEEREERQTYYDLDDMQFAMIAADDSMEIIEHTVKDRPGEVENDAGTESDRAY